MNWSSLFSFLSTALDFVGRLLPVKQAAQAEDTTTTQDTLAARAGAEAGAAAAHASRVAGPKKAQQ